MLRPTLLATIPDHRRPQGRLYALGPRRLFSLLASLSDATAYRQIQRFIQARLPPLNARGGLHWKRAPAPTAIRYPLQGLNPAAVDVAFRHHAAVLAGPHPGLPGIALAGQTRRGRFARFQQQTALQVRSALATARTLILGPGLISATDPSHDMPAAPPLSDALALSGRLVTLQARPCQKNGRIRHRHS